MSESAEGRERPPTPRGEAVGQSKTLPLASRRLTVANLRALAGALGVPTTASAEDIRLMIGGKVEELGKDQLNVEVVLDDPFPDSNFYRKVSLRDEEGVFLHVGCEQLEGMEGMVSHAQRSRSGSEGSEMNHEGSPMSQAGADSDERGSEGEHHESDHDTSGDPTAGALHECQELLRQAGEALHLEQEKTAALESELNTEQVKTAGLKSELAATKEEVSRVKDGLVAEKSKVRGAWRLHCQQLAQWDAELASGDAEIERLKARVAELECAILELHGSPEAIRPAATTVGMPEAAALRARFSTTDTLAVATSARVAATVPVTTTSVTLPPSLIPPALGIAPTPRVSAVAPPVLGGAGSVSGLATRVPGRSVSVSSASHHVSSTPPMCRDGVSTSTTTPPMVTPTIAPAPYSIVTPPTTGTTLTPAPLLTSTLTPRRGKAPPVDAYTGEDPEAVRLEVWLPTLERAATWNGWTDEERLLQLAGHLRGRALAEWNLVIPAEKYTYTAAVQALWARLDPGSKVLAAQDLRHAIQKDDESVADYILRVERCFQRAYGRDNLSAETREAILYGQVQGGLKFSIMKSPSVSGSQSYNELRMAAKNEEKRLMELRRRQQYQRGHSPDHPTSRKSFENPPAGRFQPEYGHRAPPGNQVCKCYKCGSTDHLQKNCRAPKSESTVKPKDDSEKRAGAKRIQSAPDESEAPNES